MKGRYLMIAKKHLSMKALSVVMAVLMLFTALMPSVYAGGVDGAFLPQGFRVTSETTYRVVSGVTERHFKVNNESDSNQVKCYALEIDMNNPDLSIIASTGLDDSGEWKRTTVRDQAAVMEKKLGVHVIGGINGAGFNTQTGEPGGIVIMNGETVHPDNGRPYFAILNNGKAEIRNANVPMDDVKEAISCFSSGILLKDGVIKVTNGSLNPRTAVGIKADGTVVFYVADGRQKPDSCGMTEGQMANTMQALGCVDAMLLDGGGSSTLVSTREAGSKLETRNYPSYMGVERPVASCLLVCSSAQPTGEFDHVSFSQDNYLCNPASWIRISPKGVDKNGFSAAIPSGGEIVLSDDSYGHMLGNTFYANGKQGTVEISYVLNGEVVGTSTVEITSKADDAVTAFLKKIVQTLLNIINTIETVFEKLQSGTGNRF